MKIPIYYSASGQKAMAMKLEHEIVLRASFSIGIGEGEIQSDGATVLLGSPL